MKLFALMGGKLRQGWNRFRRSSFVQLWWPAPPDDGEERRQVQAPPDPWPEAGIDPLEPAVPIDPDATDGALNLTQHAQGLKLCIDLGTFASTVALERNGNVDLAVLHYYPSGKGWEPAYEIRSTVLWVNDQPFMDPVRFGDVMHEHPDADVTRSFKRLLFEYVWFNNNRRNITRLAAMYEELLLLALEPAKSSTVRLLESRLAADAAERGGEAERLRLWKEEGGLRRLDRNRELQESIAAGARLRLCVPNSFDAQSVIVAIAGLREAFTRVVRKLFPEMQQYPNVDVSVIREAEAVTWCIDNADENARLVLVLDIGAGTTDAALVRLGNANERLRVLHRTGMPFGGDDVELIFLSTAYAQAEKSQLLNKMPREQKHEITEAARRNKETWSQSRQTVSAEMMDYLRRALEQPAKDPLPESETVGGGSEGLIVRLQGDSEQGTESVDLGNPFRIPAFINFLRLAVIATCEPLLQTTGQQVSRVLLSGAASYTPGVAPALQILLDKHQCTAKIEPAADLLARRPPMNSVPTVRRAKLACVYGGSCSLPFESIFDREFLPESLRLEIRTGAPSRVEHDLFAAGERLQDGRLVAYFSIDGRVEHICTVYRYFTPFEFIDPEYQHSSWVRRFVRRADLPDRTTTFALQLTENLEGISDLKAWITYTRNQHGLIPWVLEVPAPPQRAQDISPLTGLPLEWLWDENER